MRYANAAGAERVVSIMGTDEVDLNRNHIRWVSPLGRVADEVGSGRMRSSPSAARYRIADRAGCVLRAHLRWNCSVNHLDRRPRQRDSLADANPPDEG